MIDTTFILSVIGIALSLGGSLIACYGVHVNNQRLDHADAMYWWGYSNPMLCIWAFGWCLTLWDGSIPMLGLGCMYLYYSVSNRLGMRKKEREANV